MKISHKARLIGNSIVVTIPKQVTDQLKIHDGSIISIDVINEKIVMAIES